MFMRCCRWVADARLCAGTATLALLLSVVLLLVCSLPNVEQCVRWRHTGTFAAHIFNDTSTQ